MTRVIIGLLVVAAACGPDESSTTPPAPTTAVSATSPSTSAPGSSTVDTAPSTSRSDVSVGDLGSVTVALEAVAVADAPIDAVAHPETDVMYVAERAGRVRPLDGGELGDAVIDLSDETRTDGERGLLSIAFSTDGTTLYTHYSDDDGDGVVSAFPFDEAGIDEDDERVLLQVPQPFSNHNGGQLLVDADDLLYIGLGDGGGGGDPEGNGQDPQTLLGTILRIDPTRGDPYTIPAGNPFVNGGGASEVLLYGLRNPWRFTLDQGLLWIGDVGQNKIEEVDRVPVDDGPRNLGWNAFEGTRPFSGDDPVSDVVDPVYEYGRDDGCSVTGGVVYHGDAIAGLDGAFLFGDYCTAAVWAIDDAGTNFRSLDVEMEEGDLVGFATEADGEVLVLSLQGPIRRIVPA